MAKKEDVVRFAQALMDSQEFIRNMGVVAHIDHGKCVSGSTLISLADGRNESAERLFDEAARAGKIARKTVSETVYDVAKENVECFSFDKKTRRVVAKKITYAWKLKNAGKLVRLTFSNGLNVETTPEHKYLCVNGDGEVKEKTADAIQENDFLLAPRILETRSWSLEEMKQALLERLANDYGFFVWIEERVAQELKRNALAFGLEKLRQKIGSRLSGKAFYHCIYNGRYRLRDYVRVCSQLAFNAPYEGIESVNYRESIWKAGRTSVGIKLPRTETDFREFAHLLGLIWGDGGCSGKQILITNEDTEILQAVERIVSSVFGVKTRTIKYPAKATRIELKLGRTFYEMVTGFFGLPLKTKAAKIRVPQAIQSAPAEVARAFLQGYFDSDGTVESSRRAASLSSKSREMLLDVQLLLLRFGCLATFNEKKQALYISGSNLKTFADKVGFRLPRKQMRLLSFASKSNSPNRNTDLTPLAQSFLRRLRQRMGLHLKALPKSFEAIEFRNQPIYQTNLNQFFAKVYSFIGNPTIKDREAWEEIQGLEKTFFDCFTPQVVKKELISGEAFVYDFTVEDTHNFVGNGCIIHNTTMSDNLVAAAGLISPELAGKQQFMDYEDQEQERGITINAANITLSHNHKGKDYLINLIDTPGHIDFTGEVIRAMRAVDGVVVVVDAVEGVMPQTETVIRQALKENVKPTLFINKVDRLINELQVDEKTMQERFLKTISQVNTLIKKNTPANIKEDWSVGVQNGSVAFGSAYNNWAISAPFMKSSGISFKDIYEMCKNERQKELAQKSKLHEVVLQMVIEHLPNPVQAQKYRIPVIWGKDELESEVGKAMIGCSKDGPVAMMVTDVSVDPHAGDIATGRVYSGTVQKGLKLKLIGGKREVQLQKVGVFMGPDFVEVEKVPAGNIAALVGIKEVYAGETVSSQDMKEFESFMSTAEPVITISIEAKETKNLPKLIEVLRQLSKEDPNLRTSINSETGEHLLSGMGELHLEINKYRIEQHHKVPVETSQPIVVYHESVTRGSPILEAKSPNKHNKFKMRVEPIPEEVYAKLVEMRFDGKVKPKDRAMAEKFIDCGFEREEAKKVWCVHNNNVLVDGTKGIVALHEIRELVMQGFNDAMDGGPLAKEKVQGVKLVLEDATLHEDAIHRGPAQVLPAITRGVYACMLSADPILLEPKQTLNISVPEDYMGAVSKELGSRRTQIQDMRTEGETTVVIGLAPVAELIGFSSDIRGATQGRAIWQAEYAGYDPLPRELQQKIIKEVRTRKGMDAEVKSAGFFLE